MGNTKQMGHATVSEYSAGSLRQGEPKNFIYWYLYIITSVVCVCLKKQKLLN